MASIDQVRRNTIEAYGDAPTTPLESLEHALKIYADSPDDRVVLQGTSNIYGPGVLTSLTLGDLRALHTQLTA